MGSINNLAVIHFKYSSSRPSKQIDITIDYYNGGILDSILIYNSSRVKRLRVPL